MTKNCDNCKHYNYCKIKHGIIYHFISQMEDKVKKDYKLELKYCNEWAKQKGWTL